MVESGTGLRVPTVRVSLAASKSVTETCWPTPTPRMVRRVEPFQKSSASVRAASTTVVAVALSIVPSNSSVAPMVWRSINRVSPISLPLPFF